MQVRSFGIALILLALSLAFVGPFTHSVEAQAAADIQQQIAAHNKQIADLDAEIAAYQKQLDALGNQHQTLATSIKSLDTQRAQLTTKIKSLQQQITALNLELKQLGYQIADKQQSIDLNKRAVAQSLRDIALADNSSVVEQVFSSNNLTDAWAAVDANVTLNQALQGHTAQLVQVKQELSNQQQSVNQTQAKLVTVTTDLGTQKKAVDVTVSQKSQLLAQTKSQESSYQSLIATKKAQQKAFESELTALEGQLKSVGTASIPHVGQGILNWPFSASFAQHCIAISGVLKNNYCVTQYFGNTAFAASGAYNGSGHNGIDIGMPIGTPVQAALSGTVLGTGNTDLAHDAAGNQCYSFGKWVMIKHANGLSTMYGHLSQINVSKGQAVSTGDVLGFSGETGYATGPHLHFGVYASAGVQILTLGQFKGGASPCANASMPVAPLNAYLNPTSYL
ncbi:MAG: putative zinc metalloprotease [Parcubacteria group bacterium]|nr:putative zinc metalloprotease [Parcubacteria group bacterium]